MTKGEFTINVPVGAYNVVASKPGYRPEVIKNVVVLEGQLTIVNIQLGGEENMGTYTEPIVVVDGSEIVVNVPVEEPTVPVKFLDAGTPMVSKTVELLTEDGSSVLQTVITDAEGIATFVNVLHGNYLARINY